MRAAQKQLKKTTCANVSDAKSSRLSSGSGHVGLSTFLLDSPTDYTHRSWMECVRQLLKDTGKWVAAGNLGKNPKI